MAQVALDNLDAAGIEKPEEANGAPKLIPNTADSGYFSEPAIAELEKMGLDPHIAAGRQKHAATPLPPETTEPATTATAKEKMQHKLRSAAGKALYAARKHIIEPVFRQIKGVRNIRKFLLRGLVKVYAGGKLIFLTHNSLTIC